MYFNKGWNYSHSELVTEGFEMLTAVHWQLGWDYWAHIIYATDGNSFSSLLIWCGFEPIIENWNDLKYFFLPYTTAIYIILRVHVIDAQTHFVRTCVFKAEEVQLHSLSIRANALPAVHWIAGKELCLLWSC